MKTINKILISSLPILTAATTLPLVSCDNTTPITEADWIKCFGAIADPRDASRNFTIVGNILDGLYEFNVKSVGTLNDGHFISEDENEKQDDNYLSCMHNDVTWIKSENALKPFYSSVEMENMIGYFTYIGGVLRDSYNNATFTNNTHCNFSWKGSGEYEGLDVTGTFEFDSNKRISKMDLNGKYLQYEGPVNLTFSNYGKTTIDWTVDQKFDFTNREITAVKQGDEFVATRAELAESNGGDVYLFNMPDSLEISGLKNLKISNATGGYHVEAILNGSILKNETDYVINKDTYQNITGITLKNPLKSSDKLRFIFNAGGSYPITPTVTLTAAAE